MTISLANAGKRFESTFVSEQGIPFAATLLPAAESTPSKTDFYNATLILRVDVSCPFDSGTLISDRTNQRYLMADHETSIVSNVTLYRTHRLLRMTHLVEWERTQTTPDALTGLPKGKGKAKLGDIHCMIEPLREVADGAMHVSDERHRVVTSAELHLGDLVDNRVVKRVNKLLGVWVAEIQ